MALLHGVKPRRGKQNCSEGEAEELELPQSGDKGCVPAEEPALLVLLCHVPFLHRKSERVLGGKACRSKMRKIINPEFKQSLFF